MAERKSTSGGREFLVKWRGYDESDNTWESYDTVMDLEALDKWEEWKLESGKRRKRRSRKAVSKN